MTRFHSAVHSKKAIRIVWLLVGSSILTIASFVASLAVVERRGHGIQTAAEGITTNALPSVACLAKTRTELRQIEVALEQLVRTNELGPWRNVPDGHMEYLRLSRDALAREWARCLELPVYPGERAVQDKVSRRIGAVNASISDVLRHIEAKDWRAASRELSTQTEPAIDRADQAMVEESNLNAQQSAALATEIESLRASSRHLLSVLIALSTLLACLSAFFMARVLRRFTDLMSSHVSDMEHFAGRVAHDVRSPLASVGLALELTKRNPEASIRSGMLDRAMATLGRVNQLVDALLVFARSGRAPETADSTRVADTVRAVVEEMRPNAEANGITLEVGPPSSALVACSAGVLTSLFSNLLENAIKYMGGAPVKRVTVQVHDVGPCVRVEVRDTGPGVAPSMRERIFDPYVRAGEAGVPGVGLGLATVRRLVEAHGGTVGVRPNEAAGSVFWFELPKIRSTEEPGWRGRPLEATT